MISNLKIIPLEKKHINEIAEIEQQVMKNPWSNNSFSNSYNKLTCGKVIRKDDRTIAFIWAQKIGDEVEIFKIAVIKEFQNLGIGKILLQNFLNNCKKSDVKTVFLEVSSKNLSAVKLYKKQGFIEYGKRDNYYGFNDNALLLNFKY